MDSQELDKPETEIEDLTVSEVTAAEVKGSDAAAGRVMSFNFIADRMHDPLNIPGRRFVKNPQRHSLPRY